MTENRLSDYVGHMQHAATDVCRTAYSFHWEENSSSSHLPSNIPHKEAKCPVQL